MSFFAFVVVGCSGHSGAMRSIDPESRGSGSGPSDHPGTTKSYFFTSGQREASNGWNAWSPDTVASSL
jgi:hypothetical protein